MAHYRDLQIIGSGGFGEVWRAERAEDGEVFAKKVLAAENLNPSDVKRFEREVRLLRTLNHPRIVKVIASHIATKPCWFIMPLYEGSLRDLLPSLLGDDRKIRKVVEQLLDLAPPVREGTGIMKGAVPEIGLDAKG